MIADLKKAKTADLEAELELFREAGIEDVAAATDLKNNVQRLAEVQRLTDAHGIPVALNDEFVADNAVLAKLLLDAGAQMGEIVFAEQTDFEQAAALSVEASRRDKIVKELATLGVDLGDVSGLTTDELESKLATAQTNKPADLQQNEQEPPVDPVVDLVYQEHSEDGVARGQQYTVIDVTNVIAYGHMYKDVRLTNGETRRVTPEEYDRDVAPRA